MSAQIIPFPSSVMALETASADRAEQALEALSKAIVKRAARQGITLSDRTVKMIVESLRSAPDA